MDLHLLVHILKDTLDAKSKMIILLQESNTLKDQIIETQISQRKDFEKIIETQNSQIKDLEQLVTGAFQIFAIKLRVLPVLFC